MKFLSGNSGILLLIVGYAVLGYSGACWADWTLFDKTENADYYYDKEDVTPSSSGTVSVWTKQVYSKRGIAEMVNNLGTRYESLDHSINFLEFDCVGKIVLPLSIVYFSKNGGVLETKEPNHEWDFFLKGSMFDALYEEVCRSKKR